MFLRKDLSFMLSFLLCLVVGSNFKRSGNLGLLPHTQSKHALNDAFSTFRRLYPSTHIGRLPRRLDPESCVPAVIEISVSAKKQEIERICVPNPRDQRALLEYEEFVRPYLSPRPHDLLFVNRKGKSIAQNVSFYMNWIGRKVGMPSLTIAGLRAEMETENFIGDAESSARILEHLGHSRATAEEYYVSRDKRHSVQASFQMLALLEERGERRYAENIPSTWNPVSLNC